MKLTEKEYLMDSTELAPYLIGKLLCRKHEDGSVNKMRITETECYFGEEDTACHAHKGKTPRTRLLYEKGGVCYVYLCYGIHNLFNVISGREGHPQGVLIRGVEGYYGPGRLTKKLNIDRSLNGISLIDSGVIWIEDDGLSCEIQKGKRIGIDYAEKEDIERLWRFTMKE